MMRQLSEEADGVGKEHMIVFAELDLTSQRIERGKQSVLNENITRA